MSFEIVISPIAEKQLLKIEKKARNQIRNKINDLKDEPEKRGKSLIGILSDYRSIRAAGQRYRIIYQVKRKQIIVFIINVGIRKQGDKKDIYELLKKYIRLGLIE